MGHLIIYGPIHQVCLVGLAPSHPLIQQHRQPSTNAAAPAGPGGNLADGASDPDGNPARKREEEELSESKRRCIGGREASTREAVTDAGLSPESIEATPSVSNNIKRVDHFPLGRLKGIVFDQVTWDIGSL